MVKIQQNQGRYWVTLPKAVVETKGWKKGTSLHINIDPKTYQVTLLALDQVRANE